MRPLLYLALLTLAAPAWSLSCLRPDIVDTYERARDAKEGFWIIHGVIRADGPLAGPQPDADGRYKDGASASTKVRVLGRGLRTDGFHSIPPQDVTLTITCLAHWCGSVAPDQDLFMAIEVKPTGPELVIDPCSSRVVPYTKDGETRLLRCLRDGVCERE